MQKYEQLTVLNAKEKEVLVQLPQTISRTFKKHLEMLTEPLFCPQWVECQNQESFQ